MPSSVRRHLKGYVDLLGLGHLLQALSLNRCEGTLTVARGRDRQSVYVSPDGLRLLASTLPRVRRLGRMAKNLLGRLEEAGPEHAVREAVRRQVEEEILDLFHWTRASFAFVEGPLPARRPPLASLLLRTGATSLMLEAARRADETARLREVVPPDSARLVKIPREIYADELGEDLEIVDQVLPLVTGRRTLRAVLKASSWPPFPTLRALATLLRLGCLRALEREMAGSASR